MNRTVRFLALAAIAAGFFGCSNILVTLGLQPPPGPPVTDSAYFTTQVDGLLDKIQSTRARPFRRAVVMDFANGDGRVSELGRILTAKFNERAVGRNLFKVVPQGQVKETLTTLNIQYRGTLSREQAGKIGEELSADAVITGTIYDLQKGSDVDVTVNVVHPASGEMVSAASMNVYRSKQVQTLLEQF